MHELCSSLHTFDIGCSPVVPTGADVAPNAQEPPRIERPGLIASLEPMPSDLPHEVHAISRLMDRSKRGDAEAQHNLGHMHSLGLGVPKDLPEARRLFGLAACSGHAGALCNLGHMHSLGLGGPKDEAEARRLLGLASEQGHAIAQYSLAVMHSHGHCGAPKDEAEARRLFSLAAAQGDASSQTRLGVMHSQGRGGAEDLVEARRLICLAAAQGHGGRPPKLVAHELVELRLREPGALD